MATELTPNLNYSLHSAMPDTTSNIVSDLVGGTVASVVHAGASMWNSLPFTPEVETADLLKNISNDALRVYEENPDTIHTASFIGGMFVPTGLAMKGLGAMRAGMKGANWFSKAGREADLLKVDTIFKNAPTATGELRAATRSLYAKTAVNQAVDVVAAEAALVMMMNDHPYMEDYLDNPVKNFGIGLAFGGVLGVGLGHVADRFAINALKGAAETTSLDIIKKATKDLNVSMTGAVAIQTNDMSINALANIINKGAAEGKNVTNDLTISMAEKFMNERIVLQTRMFEEVLSADMRKYGVAEKNHYMEILSKRPEMFGVDSIETLNASSLKSETILTAKDSVTTPKPILKQTSLNKKTGLVEKKSVDANFYPNVGTNGSYGSTGSAKHYAGAATLYDDMDAVVTGAIPKGVEKVANVDSLLELSSKTAAEAQSKIIGWLGYAAKMKVAQFDNAIVSNSDTAGMTGMLSAMRSRPDLAGKTIKVKDQSLVYQTIMNQQVASTGAAPATYIAKAQQLINHVELGKTDYINLRSDTSLSTEASRLVHSWIGGPGAWNMHLGATAAGARGYSAIGKRLQSGTKEGLSPQIADAERAFTEIYNSKSSSKVRSLFASMADSEGYVYLYRGIKAREVRGSAPVESMTTNYDKAVEFAKASNGRVDLYKIHTDDIVGALADIAGSAQDSTEILVKASARHSEATLDNTGKVVYQRSLAAQQSSIKPPSDTHAVDADGLAAMIRKQKPHEIDSLNALGIPPASIAIKTNTPVEVVQAYLYGATKGSGAFEDVLDKLRTSVAMDPTTGNSLFSKETGEAALSITNKPIRLKGNLKKNPHIEGHAALTNKQMADMNDLFVENILLQSKSPAVKAFGEYMSENSTMFKILNDHLSNANQSTAGARFVNSFDFYARNMQDIGPVVSAIAKQREHLANAMMERVVTPIKSFMVSAKADPVAVVEFNTFKTVNDSLKGWRGVNSKGELVQKVMRDAPDPKDATKTIQTEVLEPVLYQGAPYSLKNSGNIALVAEMSRHGKELLDLANTSRKIKGVGNIQDIGLWLPSFNPVNKYIAYVHNPGENTTQLIYAKSADSLTALVGEYKAHLSSIGDVDTKVYNKGIEQEMWSMMNGRMDPLTMKIADTSMLKSGSASSAIVPNNLDVFGEILGGYEHYISAQMRNLVDVSMSDTMHLLDRMSAVNKYLDTNQPLDKVKKGTSQPKDPATVIKNTLLGNSLLGEYGGWQTINNGFETGLAIGHKAFNTVWDSAVGPVIKGIFGKKDLDTKAMEKVNFETLSKELAKAGVPNPWKDFDQALAAKYGVGALEQSTDTSKRIVYAGNALAATIALRVGELAQPLVNIMSLPILTYLAKAQQHPDVFLGIQKAGVPLPSMSKVMFDGARASNSPAWKHMSDRWEELGYFTPMISEANSTLHMTRSMDKGMIAATEKALNSRFVELASKPADWSEGFVRRQTMFTGAVLAKHLYPGLDDAGVTVFARDFMDKAVGNFHASQRPVFFQGTLGVALGLFQTYSLTLAQSVYRHAELGNYKVLGKAALLQSGIFGVGSMPGFQAISNQIGENFSDDHIDLVTGTYRSVADPMAETILYGLPSQLGVGTHTRGDVNPRFPGLTEDSLVGVNFAKQIATSVKQIVGAVAQGDSSIPRALGEALSMQSMSRPLARGAEIAMGYSITGKGNTVQVPAEVWTLSGVGARILGTRPIEEIKLRDAMHLDSFYGAADFENRQGVIDNIQTHIRSGSLDDGKISSAAEKYFRNGGTPTGWRAAVNNAIATTETSGKEALLHKLRPNSALNMMIDMND